MACRVGISKRPQERIAHWKRVEGHTYSRVIGRNLTYDGAQRRETAEAAARGCYRAAGGDPGNDRYRRVWCVYYVSGGRIR